MQGLRRHLRSNVVGYVALVVALAGVPTAWAALGKNTVGTKQLKNNAVKRSKIAKNAVNSAKVANGSLRGSDFAAGQLPQGAQGPEGKPGTTEIRAIAFVERGATSFNPSVPVRGFKSVSLKATGIYCLVPEAGLDGELDPPIITLEYGSSEGENFTAMWDQNTGECEPHEYEIKTYNAEKETSPTDKAAFVIMVP
jgi:hypothetical protein